MLIFQQTWFAVIHHVCGEHQWAGGAWKRSTEEAGPGEKTYLQKSSKAAAASLRKTVFDKQSLNNLEFYVWFRLVFIVNSSKCFSLVHGLLP